MNIPLERIGRPAAILAAIVFVSVNAVNALHKGGDAEVFFDGGRRLIHGLPLYADSGPASGFIGPPFQALFFAPFAAIDAVSEPGASLTWYALNLIALGAGLYYWWRTCSAIRTPPPRELTWTEAAGGAVALVAVLLPLQTNFEHQNMNTLLLAMLGAAAWTFMNGASITSGILLGTATALKAFPALLIVYAAVARRWRVCATAVLTATLLTASPVVVYGLRGWSTQMRDWSQIGSAGWPRRGNNQSLLAALDRATAGWGVSGVTSAAESPIVFGLFLLLGALAASAFVIVFLRPPRRVLVPCGITAALVLAVLCAPIAWDHYWTLMFPAFLLVHYGSRPDLLGRGGTWIFWTAAVLTTGISGVTVGRTGWNTARQLSVSTLAGLLLYVALLLLARRLAQRESAPAETPGVNSKRHTPNSKTAQD